MRPIFAMDKDALVAIGREHWREYLPAKYAALRDAGTLTAELEAAAELTLQEMAGHRSAGFRQHEAWAMAREHYLILPEEPDEGAEPMPITAAFNAMAEKNRAMRQIDDDED